MNPNFRRGLRHPYTKDWVQTSYVSKDSEQSNITARVLMGHPVVHLRPILFVLYRNRGTIHPRNICWQNWIIPVAWISRRLERCLCGCSWKRWRNPARRLLDQEAYFWCSIWQRERQLRIHFSHQIRVEMEAIIQYILLSLICRQPLQWVAEVCSRLQLALQCHLSLLEEFKHTVMHQQRLASR